MAGQADDLSALVALLRTLGDDDYAALASRGLVRRARKELASATPGGWVEGGAGGHAVVAVGQHTVRVPAAGPARATCTCPSPGVCQHVIAASLALAEGQAAAVAEAGNEPDAWSVVDLPRLRKWTGADHWRQAVELARQAKVAAPRDDAPVVVRFPDGSEARLPPGGSLDALITTAPARLQRRVLAAAVIAARNLQAEVAGLEAGEAWQLPAGLLQSLQEQLGECVRLGLNRLTPSTLARLETLAVQCRSAGLYRTAREIESCASEVRWIHARDAQSDPERLLDRVAQLYALAEALLARPEAPDPALVGTARSKYLETATLRLIGCGAYRWQTASGFHGLTVLFWVPETAQFASWSESRPVGSGDGFDPVGRYHAEGPWPFSGSLERLSRSRFDLLRPRLNDQRRLSASSASLVESIGETSRETLPPAYGDWRALRAGFAAQPSLGLTRRAALDFVVRLQPRRFHAPHFDEIEQRLVWPLEDDAGELLDVVLPFVAENANAIQWIEKHTASAGDSLVGYYQPGPSDAFFPVARVTAGEPPAIQSIVFAEVEAAKTGWLLRLARRRPHAAWTPPAAQIESLGGDLEMTPARQLLAPARERILCLAESGLVGPHGQEEWQTLCGDLAKAGLITLARSLSRAATSPAALLRSAYLLALYWHAG